MKVESFKEIVLSYVENRSFVVVAGLVVIPILFFVLVYFPLTSFKENCERKRILLKKKIDKIEKLLVDYKTLSDAVLNAESKIPPSSFDFTTYVERFFTQNGVNVKNVKVTNSGTFGSIKKYIVTVNFAQSPLDGVARSIFNVENGKFYGKSLSFLVSDQDRDGLVSGKVSFLFYGREQ